MFYIDSYRITHRPSFLTLCMFSAFLHPAPSTCTLSCSALSPPPLRTQSSSRSQIWYRPPTIQMILRPSFPPPPPLRFSRDSCQQWLIQMTRPPPPPSLTFFSRSRLLSTMTDPDGLSPSSSSGLLSSTCTIVTLSTDAPAASLSFSVLEMCGTRGSRRSSFLLEISSRSSLLSITVNI